MICWCILLEHFNFWVNQPDIYYFYRKASVFIYIFKFNILFPSFRIKTLANELSSSLYFGTSRELHSMHFRLTRKPVNPLLVCYLITNFPRKRYDMFAQHFDLLKHSWTTGASHFNLRMCALKSNQMPTKKPRLRKCFFSFNTLMLFRFLILFRRKVRNTLSENRYVLDFPITRCRNTCNVRAFQNRHLWQVEVIAVHAIRVCCVYFRKHCDNVKLWLKASLCLVSRSTLIVIWN